MDIYKSQTLQDVSIRIHSIKDDGTDNTGDVANLSTVILDPAGNELVGTTNYTEAVFDEIGTTGEYECLFPSTALTKVFTSVDQNNPYTVKLITSTADIGSSGPSHVRIMSVYPWENALETTSQDILDQITGTGNRTITIHVQDAVAAPIADVLVRIGTASISTDPAGDAIFALDDGAYDVILRKDFVTFTVPEPLTVSGDGTHIFIGTVFAPAAPVEPNTCVVYGNTRDLGAIKVAGVTISISETDDKTFSNGVKIVKPVETTSDAEGYWQLEVIRSSALIPLGSPYEVNMSDDGAFRYTTTITVPDQDSVEFSTIAGT
jgi:hypothetical protein